MTLTKGFLKPQNNFSLSRNQIIVGLLIGISLALSLYASASFFFEFFRRTSSLYCDAIFQFTKEERSFYAWFFAAIAIILGQNITFWFWAKRCKSELKSSNTVGLRLKNIAHEQSNLSTYTFAWLARLGTLCFIFFGTSSFYPNYNYLDLRQNYAFLFTLIPIVLWMNSWTTISRLFKRKALKWMASSAFLILGSSFLLSQVNIMDHNAWDEQQIQSNLLYRYEVVPPKSDHSKRFEKHSRLVEFTIGYNKADKSQEPTLIFKNAIIGLDEIASTILSPYSERDEKEIPFITIKITADKRVPIAFIYQMKQELRKVNALKVSFTLNQNNTNSPLARISNVGFPIILPPLFMPQSNSKFKIPPPPPPNINEFTNLIEITVSESSSISVNDQSTMIDLLSDQITASIKANPDYLILLDIDNSMSLQQYIDIMSELRSIINDLRNLKSMKVYSKSYNKLSLDQQKSIRQSVPSRIIDKIYLAEMKAAENAERKD